METQPLVSIITPCYNGELFLNRFFNSIINQTYKNIELIFIDDGSTDNTSKIAQNYIDVFKKNSMDLTYVFQENSGQAAAMNKGLKMFNGEYLTWVDSDDVMLPENIEKKVNFLNSHKECDFVFCQAEEVLENKLDKSINIVKRERKSDTDNLFIDYIYGKNVLYGPGSILVRRDFLEMAIPSKTIYESREGQNWQMMLPLSYLGKCGYIDEILVKFVARTDSHCRKERSLEELLNREDGFISLAIETINKIPKMNDEEKQEYSRLVKVLHLRRQLDLCSDYKNIKLARVYRKKLYQLGEKIGVFDFVIPKLIRAKYYIYKNK